MSGRLTRLLGPLQKSQAAATSTSALRNLWAQVPCQQLHEYTGTGLLAQADLLCISSTPVKREQQQTVPQTQRCLCGGRHHQTLGQDHLASRCLYSSQSQKGNGDSQAEDQQPPSAEASHSGQPQRQQPKQQQQQQQQQSPNVGQDQSPPEAPVSSSSSTSGESDAGHHSSKDPQDGPNNSSNRSATDSEPSSHDPSSTSSKATSSDSSSSGISASNDSSSSSSSKQNPLGLDSEEGVTELLVEWRIKTLEWYGGGLNYVINSYLQMPSMSSWSHLYPPAKPPGLLSRMLFPKGSSYFSWLLKWQFRRSTPITIPILQTAHEDLKPEGSIPEFRQHLSMAITTVLQLYSQADWQGLKPMISAGLLESMQSAYDTQTEAAQSQGLSLQDVNLDIHKLDIVCAHAITAEQLSAIDEWRSREEAVGAKSNSSHKANSMWDVVYVHVESTWSATLQTSAGSEKYSRPKSGYWVFCRGPVQFDDVVPADLPWFVLAWL